MLRHETDARRQPDLAGAGSGVGEVVNGSAIGVSVATGNSPAEYGYLEAYWSSSTTCSGTQIVEKPSRSAAVATVLTGSVLAFIVKDWNLTYGESGSRVFTGTGCTVLDR